MKTSKFRALKPGDGVIHKRYGKAVVKEYIPDFGPVLQFITDAGFLCIFIDAFMDKKPIGFNAYLEHKNGCITGTFEPGPDDIPVDPEPIFDELEKGWEWCSAYGRYGWQLGNAVLVVSHEADGVTLLGAKIGENFAAVPKAVPYLQAALSS